MKQPHLSWLFGLTVGLFVLAVNPASALAAAKFYISPASGNYKVGDTITATVLIDSGGAAINAAEGSISYPESLVEYQSVHTVSIGSIFSFWTSGPIGNSTGVTFSGGLPHPGYNGSSGKVLAVNLKAKANGTVTIDMKGTKILADDGAGTNIYGSSSSATYMIGGTAAPAKKTTSAGLKVTSSTHTDPDKWYTARTVTLKWSHGTPVNGYVYAFDQSTTTVPTGKAGKETTKTYNDVADGKWYFHIRAQGTDGKLGDTVHFSVNIDNVPPNEFKMTINQEGGASSPTPAVTFEATDDLSGIDRYEAVIDGGEPFAIKSGDKLPKQRPGSHTLIIKAYDKAGNVRESTASYKIVGIDPPVIVDWTKLIGLLQPARFIGRSRPDDTIYVFIGDKEVAQFLAKDKQVPYDRLGSRGYVAVGFGGEIAWEYAHTDPLLPGPHSFRFSLTTADGSESELTQPYKVQVESSTFTLFGRTIRTWYIISLLLLIILFLMAVILYLLRKIHQLMRHGGAAIGDFVRKVRRVFSEIESDLLHDVDRAMPDHELSSGSVKDAKRELKEEIKETIEEEEHKVELELGQAAPHSASTDKPKRRKTTPKSPKIDLGPKQLPGESETPLTPPAQPDN